MSRDIWDMDDLLGDDGIRSYDTPKPFKHQAMVEDFLADITVERGNEQYVHYTEKRRKALASLKNDEAQPFLDELIRGVVREGFHEQVKLFDEFFMQVVLSTLTDYGAQKLSLDYSRFERMEEFGKGLRGTADRPISAHYILPRCSDELSIGAEADHCRISFTGKAIIVGNNAHASSFLVSEPRNMYVGLGAKNCTFYMACISPGDVLQAQKDNNSWEGLGQINYRGGENSLTLNGTFHAKGNRLLIPDGKGGWHEVKLV